MTPTLSWRQAVAACWQCPSVRAIPHPYLQLPPRHILWFTTCAQLVWNTHPLFIQIHPRTPSHGVAAPHYGACKHNIAVWEYNNKFLIVWTFLLPISVIVSFILNTYPQLSPRLEAHRQWLETKKSLKGLSILLARGEQHTNLLSADSQEFSSEWFFFLQKWTQTNTESLDELGWKRKH